MAVLALVVAVVVGGCKGSPSGSTTEGSSPDTASARSEPDSGKAERDDDPENKREWSKRIRRQLERRSDDPEPAPGADRGEAAGCQLFPDSCGRGESCFVDPAGERTCDSYEPNKTIGDPCGPSDRCNAGQQCVGGASPICLETCRPGGGPWDCPSDRVCTRVLGPDDEPFDWGVCRPIVDRCRPWPNDDCDIGQACVPTPAGRRCRDYRETAEPGEACVNPSDCRIGQVCVVDESGLGACRVRCDADHPCEGAECRPFPERDFGFCPGTAGREATEESQGRSITGF